MSYHPRIEVSNIVSHTSSRTRNCELWFINNKELQEATLGYVGKYAKGYGVKLYGVAIEGDHLHDLALYPKCNRASYKRDLNASVAKAVRRHCPRYPGGRLWGRRYSSEFIPGDEDIENKFFYLALQPVQDGLVERLSEYPGYNFFHDAVCGIKRRVKVVRYGEYQEAKRWHPEVSIVDYTDTYQLEYKRLPGYEKLSPEQYKKVMYAKLEERRREIVKERLSKGQGFAGRAALIKKVPGSMAQHPKQTDRYGHRPRVLCSDPELRRIFLSWYFGIYNAYKEASLEYRQNKKAKFPPGTYKPPLFTRAYQYVH
jgi:hypothetical protein